MEEKKYNYVYEITYSDGKKYIGVRSCNCEIIHDNYYGSSKLIPKEVMDNRTKAILSTYRTRDEAMNEEIRLHAMYNVKDNPNYYNQCNSTSTKFRASKESLRKGAITRTGRTAKTHEYIAKQVESRAKYKGIENRTEAQRKADTDKEKIARANLKRKLLSGENQTEAQKIGRISMKEKITGVKNPKKGHPGIKSTSFVPWYYIDAEGNRFEMFDMTKKQFSEKISISYRVLIYRFSKENEHKPLTQTTKKTKMIKNWIFGNLITPVQSLTPKPKRKLK